MTAPGGSAFRIPEDATLPTHRREKLSQILARRVVHDIVSRNLQPGDMLEGESEMLQRYGVGRASLREALRVLEVHGLISIRPGPGGGPVVSQVDGGDFGRMSTLYFQMTRAQYAELIQARLVLEPVVARMAAEAHDPAHVEQLEQLMRDCELIPVEDHQRWVQGANAFHTAIATMSGNRILELMASSLREIYRDRVIHKPIVPLDNRREVWTAHLKIARAIIKGDPKTAERHMHDHMQMVAHYVAQTYPGVLDEIIDWG